MKLTHKSIGEMFNYVDLSNVKSIDTLRSSIAKAGKKGKDQDHSNVIKGDLFEIFLEFFLKKFGGSNILPVSHYTVSDIHLDRGVDGIGIGPNGEKVTVQAKFRFDPGHFPKYKELATFISQSLLRYKVTNPKNMLIFTTADEVNHIAKEEMQEAGVIVFGRLQFKKLIGPENLLFWEEFKNVFSSSVPELKKRKRKELFPHQKEALTDAKLFLNNDLKTKAQIIAPTGSGKTLIESRAIEESIKKGNLIHVVAAPRLVLVENLKSEFWQDKAEELEWDRFTFSSLNDEEIELFSGDDLKKIKPTTNIKQVRSRIEDSLKNKKALVIFSTYHSLHKIITVLNKLNEKAVLIADEAHNLVQRGFSKLVETFPTHKALFFTATRKTGSDKEGLGMNNPERFGEVIHQISPQRMIREGRIVPPRMLFAFVEAEKNNLEASIIKNTVRYFKDLHASKKDCKIIISCDSAIRAHELEESKALRNGLPEFHIRAVTSRRERMKAERRDILGKEFIENKNVLLTQYDVISEGVDLPGVTAVMPMRLLNDIKCTQTIGRATRVTPADREALKKGKIKVGKPEGWEKPFAWVIIPIVKGEPLSHEAKIKIAEVIHNLRSADYDIDVEKFIDDALPEGVDKTVEFDEFGDDKPRNREQLVKDLEERIEIIEENEREALSMFGNVRPDNFDQELFEDVFSK